MGLGEIMIVVHGFVWLMLQGKSEVQQEKESKRGDPTGPSPHVRVTQGCTHGTKGNTSKYWQEIYGMRRSAWLPSSTHFTMLFLSNHSIWKFLILYYYYTQGGGNIFLLKNLVCSHVLRKQAHAHKKAKAPCIWAPKSTLLYCCVAFWHVSL